MNPGGHSSLPKRKIPMSSFPGGSGAGFSPESLGWARGGGCSRNGPLQHKIPAGKDGMLSSLAQELELLLFQRLLGTLINFLLIPSFPEAEFHPPGAQ